MLVQRPRFIRRDLVLHGNVGPEALVVLRPEPRSPPAGKLTPHGRKVRRRQLVGHAPAQEADVRRGQGEGFVAAADFSQVSGDLSFVFRGQSVK